MDDDKVQEVLRELERAFHIDYSRLIHDYTARAAAQLPHDPEVMAEVTIVLSDKSDVYGVLPLGEIK